MSTSQSTGKPNVKKHFTSSILLWVRTDQPRQTGMDYWKGPHSGIIAATPGLEEYRQIHLAEHNPGLWPATSGMETAIPGDRKIDGVAEVTFQSALAPLQGRKQTALAYKDEVNVFRRTLLYGGAPNSSRWFDVAGPAAIVGSRAIIYLRRRDGVRAGEFRKFINNQLGPGLANTGVLKELRTQTFLPWSEKLWDTPSVAHDNPHDQRFHASVILGFATTATRDAFFTSSPVENLSRQLAPLASAIHAYDIEAALTYVKHGHALPHYEE
ncbi:strictosidine synthase [Arthrobacter sp. Soil736]|uniref:hypothetical protein n=1 Tax=Arthrobacter sp. Soil736 TaxID=1736395 RepID=UPI0006FEA8D3|nr:hypothetical protein [Arthrobacter sp. Soil736]KRE54774.1 strictosidine synthase [Arthrobacter sp. Soil736]